MVVSMLRRVERGTSRPTKATSSSPATAPHCDLERRATLPHFPWVAFSPFTATFFERVSFEKESISVNT